RTFRVDLPSTGLYRIRAAFGAIGKTARNFVRFKDGDVTFKTISDASTSSMSQFTDAYGTRRSSAAAWLSANAAIEHVFTSTVLQLEIGDPDQATGDSTRVAHLLLERFTGIAADSGVTGNYYGTHVGATVGVPALTDDENDAAVSY